MIIYIHGFGSSALSTKAEKIQNMPLNEPFLALSLSTIPHLAMKTLVPYHQYKDGLKIA